MKTGVFDDKAANAQDANNYFLTPAIMCDFGYLDARFRYGWYRYSEMGSELYPEVPVLMISGHGNIETAVQALNLERSFIEKPFKTERLLLTVGVLYNKDVWLVRMLSLGQVADNTARLIGQSSV